MEHWSNDTDGGKLAHCHFIQRISHIGLGLHVGLHSERSALNCLNLVTHDLCTHVCGVWMWNYNSDTHQTWNAQTAKCHKVISVSVQPTFEFPSSADHYRLLIVVPNG